MLRNLLKLQVLDINKILLQNYIKLGMNETELVLLLHLFSLYEKNKTILSFSGIKNKMTISSTEVSNTFNSLLSKGFLEINSEINKNGREQECFDLMPTLELINQMFFAEEETNKEIIKKGEISNIVLKFERELARSLSPVELEIIGKMAQEYSEDEINKAIVEAVKSSAINLRYIEKILRNNKEEEVEVDPNRAKAVDEFLNRIVR